MTLCFVTGNKNKFAEAERILEDVEQLKLNIDEVQSMDRKEIITAKLQEAMTQHSGPLFCEDVSLCLSAFNGFPGPLVKFWVASGKSKDLVRRVHAFNDHSAQAICSIGYFDGKKMHFFEGVVEGKIVAPRVDSDFGFDPIFEVAVSKKTFAEMTADEKNVCSHRARALAKLKDFLESQ